MNQTGKRETMGITDQSLVGRGVVFIAAKIKLRRAECILFWYVKIKIMGVVLVSYIGCHLLVHLENAFTITFTEVMFIGNLRVYFCFCTLLCFISVFWCGTCCRFKRHVRASCQYVCVLRTKKLKFKGGRLRTCVNYENEILSF